MPYGLVAEFPLGTYRAGVGEGQQDRWPSIARVHAALLAAAGQGVRAHEIDGHLEPGDDDVAALTWLEENPPDGLVVPLSSVHVPSTTAYREMGLLKPKSVGTKKLPKRDNGVVALAGSVMWLWEAEPPADVRQSLEDLCPDVPYLGRSDSPVRLHTLATVRHPATHRRDPAASLVNRRPWDIEVDAPRVGRTSALRRAFRTRATAPPPHPRHDRAGTDEDDLRPFSEPAGLGRERYVSVDRDVDPAVPWEYVYVLPISRGGPVPVERRVRWCVALHRALISLHGDGAPPLLTGKYAEGVALPANRVAIQIVDRSPALSFDLPTHQAFTVAIPAGADPADVQAVEAALSALRVVRRPGRDLALVPWSERPDAVPGDAFWHTSTAVNERHWVTTPTVPETRPPGNGSWTIADTATLSVALVFRELLEDGRLASLPRAQRLRALANLGLARGLEVLDVQKLTTTDVARYVHKTPAGLVIQPYVATLRLGSLVPTNAAWLAIGQSRHLGGGHLIPVDLDETPPERRHE